MFKKYIIPIGKCLSLEPSSINNNKFEKVTYKTKNIKIVSPEETEYEIEGEENITEDTGSSSNYDLSINENPFKIIPNETESNAKSYKKIAKEKGVSFEREAGGSNWDYNIIGFKYTINRIDRNFYDENGDLKIMRYYYYEYNLDISNNTIIREFNKEIKLKIKNKMSLAVAKKNNVLSNAIIDKEINLVNNANPSYEFDDDTLEMYYTLFDDILSGKLELTFYLPVQKRIFNTSYGTITDTNYDCYVINNILITFPKIEENENEEKYLGINNSELEYTLDNNHFDYDDNYYEENDGTQTILTIHNANEIYNNYKNQKITFQATVVVSDFYNENGDLIINKENGELISVGDKIKFKNNKNSNNNFFDKEYIITSVEFNYNGVPKMNIKGKEV